MISNANQSRKNIPLLSSSAAWAQPPTFISGLHLFSFYFPAHSDHVQSMASLTLPAYLFSSSHQTSKHPRVNAWATGNGRRSWWAPLFHAAFTGDQGRSEKREVTRDFEEEVKDVESPASISFSALTHEKARILRREMRATETWHDAMYHSAIASRLASPDQA